MAQADPPDYQRALHGAHPTDRAKWRSPSAYSSMLGIDCPQTAVDPPLELVHSELHRAGGPAGRLHADPARGRASRHSRLNQRRTNYAEACRCHPAERDLLGTREATSGDIDYATHLSGRRIEIRDLRKDVIRRHGLRQ